MLIAHNTERVRSQNRAPPGLHSPPLAGPSRHDAYPPIPQANDLIGDQRQNIEALGAISHALGEMGDDFGQLLVDRENGMQHVTGFGTF